MVTSDMFTTAVLMKHAAWIGTGAWLGRPLAERINPLIALRDNQVARKHTLRHGLGPRSLDVPTAADPMRYNALEWALSQVHPNVRANLPSNPELNDLIKLQGRPTVLPDRTGLPGNAGRVTWYYPELGLRYAANPRSSIILDTVTAHGLRDATPTQLVRRNNFIEEAMKLHPSVQDPGLLTRVLAPPAQRLPGVAPPGPRRFGPLDNR